MRLFSGLVLASLLATGSAFAQGSIPFIAGLQLESGSGMLPQGKVGSGLIRATPFLGAWLQGIGYAKLGFSYWNAKVTDSADVDVGLTERDLSLQLATSLGGAGRPYLIASYVRAKQLSESGDASWNEWGTGLGAFFQMNSLSALMLEGEYRWIGKHYDPVRQVDLKGTRIQLNLGFVVYFY